MSLQDEHLKQALQSAPDRDLAPSDAVRQKILDHAKNAAPKRAGWFNRFKAWRINSWQLVGMSTLASVFLVTMMLRPQLHKEPIWVGAETEDIAQVDDVQSETPAPEKLESEEANSASQTELMPATDEEVLTATADDFTRLSKKNELVKPKPKTIIKEKKANSEVKTQSTARLAERKEVTVVNQPVAVAEAEADIAEEVVVADKVVSGRASPMERRQTVEKPNVSARKSALPSNEIGRGEMLAKQDIKDGKFRLLFVDGTWPVGKPFVDEETGFRVESASNVAASLSEAAAEAYNSVMRDWYHANPNHDLTD